MVTNYFFLFKHEITLSLGLPAKQILAVRTRKKFCSHEPLLTAPDLELFEFSLGPYQKDSDGGGRDSAIVKFYDLDFVFLRFEGFLDLLLTILLSHFSGFMTFPSQSRNLRLYIQDHHRHMLGYHRLLTT